MSIRRRWPLALLAALVLLAGALMLGGRFWPRGPIPVGEPTAPPEGPGWIDLLSEEHAPLWKNITDDKDIFAIEDGVLHIYGRTWFPLRYVGYTGRDFGDFDLHLAFKLTRRANSGVFLRVQENDPVRRGWEVQVLEDYGKPPHRHGCGAIYDIVTPMYNMSRPPGEWNSFDISVRGHIVKVTMNGWLIVHADFSKMTEPLGKFPLPYAEMPLSGLIALQDHGGEVWFRDIRVRPAGDADEAPAPGNG